jgi:hypothetical protein
MNEHYYKILGALDAYLNSEGVKAVVAGSGSLQSAFAILTEARDRYRAAGAKVEAALQEFDREGGNTETGLGKLILDAIQHLRIDTYPAAGPSVAAALEQVVSDINSTRKGTTTAMVSSSSNVNWPRTSSSSSY